MNNDKNILKQLQSESFRIFKEIKNIDTEMEKLKQTKSDKELKLEEVKAKIEDIKADTIIISEHAILRYLERVKGIDLEEIQKEILPTPELRKSIATCGDGKYMVDEFALRIKKNVVVTILTKDEEENG